MIGTLVFAASFAIAPAALPAQRKIVEQPPAQINRPGTPAPKILTVAIVPWTLSKGTKTAEKTAKETVVALFTGAGKTVVPESVTSDFWVKEFGSARETHLYSKKGEEPAPMPTAQELLRLGKAMGVDFVTAGRAKWHTRSIWVGLGPKTKATCTVDLIIIDVNKAEVVLEAKNVSADSHKRETTAEIAATILINIGFTALSGGPKTPHQQKSARAAISEAMEPWLKINVRPQSIGR